MAAKLYYSAFVPAFLGNGLPAPGAYLYFYYTETDNLAPVYSNSGLTTPLTNPVQADAAGRFPNIYLDGDIIYRVRVTDKRGEPIGDDVDPYIPGQALKGDTGPADNTYFNLATLKAQPTTNGTSRLVSDSVVVDGSFNWTLGDYTGLDDDANIIESDDTPLSEGAWVRQTSDSITIQAEGDGAVIQSLKTWIFERAVSVKAYGAKGDGVTDDTAAIHKARDSGASILYFPPGIYMTTGLVFSSSDSVVKLDLGARLDINDTGGATIKLISDTSRIAIDIQKSPFTVTGGQLTSTGTTFDGLATIGIRHGNSTQGRYDLHIDNILINEAFSSRAIQTIANVNVTIENCRLYGGSTDLGSLCYVIASEPNGFSGSTSVTLRNNYINGGLRGIYLNATSWVTYDRNIIEYSGTTSTLSYDAALHLVNCGIFVGQNLYGEANKRNKFFTDSTTILLNDEMFAATAPDVVNYSGLAFDSRGNLRMTNRSIQVGDWLPDPNVSRSTTAGLHLEGSGSGLTLALNKVQVLTVRQPAVSDAAAATYVAPTGGTTEDTEARAALVELAADVASLRTQLNLALARLRTHGLIET